MAFAYSGELRNETPPNRFAFLLASFAAASLVHAADDKASVERTIMGYDHEMEQGYAAKDASRVYRHCDPTYMFSSLDKSATSDLASNRKALDESFGDINTIQMKTAPRRPTWLATNSICVTNRKINFVSAELAYV